MEEDEHNLKLDNNQPDKQNCLINKRDEDVKEVASCSKKEETKDSSKSSKKEVSTPTPTTIQNSTEPRCPICLDQVKEKAFIDSCFHEFCFSCLVEWSKQKPECPLCKSSFNNILHNVQSDSKYDQYHVKKSSTSFSDSLWTLVTDRRFRYSTHLTPETISQRSRVHRSERMIESEIAFHSMRHEPSSMRRRIYEENLWVRSQPSSRICCISPSFYTRNIACTHRLIPWLYRELLVVMPYNESHQIPFVVERIMALILRYDIKSQEFFRHIESYTAAHTAHFIHEFYNFAVAPYESMESYDQHAQYGMALGEAFQTNSSPDSDVIPLPVNEAISQKSGSRRKKERYSPTKRVKEHKNRASSSCSSSHVSSKIILTQKSGNCLSSSVVSNNTVEFTNPIDISNSVQVPGPSTSRATTVTEFSTETSNPDLEESNKVDCLTDQDDDKCQDAKVMKTRCEKTSERINLSSDVYFSTFTEEDDNMLSSSDVEKVVCPTLSLSPLHSSSSDDDDDIKLLSS